MGVLAVAALCALAQNPDWPPLDPDLPAPAFADPARWPDDPAYGPGPDCEGARDLFGFTPACLPNIEAPELGTGLAVDHAWALTAGQPAVTIALADDGVDLGHPDLVTRFALNPGELPFPDVGIPTVRHDVNGDGAFTVLDFTAATGTMAPTLDTVRDRRLLAREDRGDVDGNGLLDPRDLLTVFADGRDGDRNGYVDDIVGWDFVEDDNDPSAPSRTDRGTQAALRAVATANNGVDGAGACPRCTALPMRVSARGLGGADRGAWAILYASGRRAPVVHVGPALWGASPLLDDAVRLAFSRGTLVVAAAGTGATALANTAWPDARVLVVGTVGLDRADPAEATSTVHPDPCGRFGDALDVSGAGRCDDGASARVAGVAGLCLSAARGLDPGLVPLEPGLLPGELWGVLQATATDLDAPGEDRRTGAGRVNARAAVQAVLQRAIPPHARFVSPARGAVLDPSLGGAAEVELAASRSRHARLRWTLSAAPGRDPRPEAFVELEAGVFEPGEARTARANLPLVEWRDDPTRALDAELTLQLALQDASGEGPSTTVRRRVFVHRDLDVLPAFPIELGAGNEGGARVARLDGDGPAVILAGTTDGRVHAIDGRGRLREGFPVRGPDAAWARAHPQLPELTGAELTAPIDAIQAPLSVGPLGPEGAPLIVTVTARGGLLAFGPRGAVQAGFPMDLGPGTPRAFDLPAGATHAAALRGARAGGRIFVSDPGGDLVVVAPDGSVQRRVALGAPGGAPAVAGDGLTFVATRRTLIRIEPGADTPAEGWPQALDSFYEAEGRASATLPGPVLAPSEAGRLAFVATWGGALAIFSSGGVRTLPGFAWRTALGLADLTRDGQDELIATIAKEVDFAGLPPEAEASAARAAYDVQAATLRARFETAGRGADHAPLILDVGGDVSPEVLFGDDEGRLWALDREGRVARGFPKLTGDPIVGAPAVGDLDGDGRLELVAITRTGRVWAWRLAVSVDTPVAWGGARGGLLSRGDATAADPAAAPDRAEGCRDLGPGAGLPLWVMVAALGLRRRRR